MTDFASPVFSVAEKIIHSRALRQCLQHKEFPECQNEVKQSRARFDNFWKVVKSGDALFRKPPYSLF